MGLDMYLTKKVYVGGEFSDVQDKEKEISFDFMKFGKKEEYKFQIKDISEVVIRIGYWRKANAIHKWFVDNCQEGVDDCREAYVSSQQLIALKDICKEIVNTKDKEKQEELAQSKLPPQSGFFFGGDSIDDYYLECLQYTIEIIEKLQKNSDFEFGDYYYSSSW